MSEMKAKKQFISLFIVLFIISITFLVPFSKVHGAKAKQSNYQENIDQILADMPVATIALGFNKSLKAEEAGQIRLLASIEMSGDSLEKIIREESGDEIHIEMIQIKTSRKLSARLQGQAFEIRNTSEEVKFINEGGLAEWLWQVVAREPGTHSLLIQLETLISANGKEQPLPVKTFEYAVSVEAAAPAPQSFWQGIREKLDRYTYLFLLLVLVISVTAVLIFNYRRKRSARATKIGAKTGAAKALKTISPPETIADVAISDAAISSYNQDLLGTSSLAEGLSLFLRNQSTNPPVTMAITGNWGSGKTSVMKMLREYLEKNNYRPVWFNAWHHHQEEHLFGALLETVRKEAIPPILHASGLIFRLRLLAIRTREHKIVSLLILAAALFLYALDIPLDLFIKIAKTPSENPLISVSVFTLLVGTLTSVTKGITAFGLIPGQLFRKVGAALRTGGVYADPGLRYRINHYLKDITRALNKRTLVIFIDDMDRCPQGQVLNLLETINFLSSSPGKSFIVLGMALDKVLHSISREFSDTVEEALQEIKDEAQDRRRQRLKKERLEYAKNYLEKMINIEVHLPEIPAEEMKKLADPEARLRKQQEARESAKIPIINSIDQKIFPFLFAGLILGGVYFAGMQIHSNYPEAFAPVTAKTAQKQESKGENAAARDKTDQGVDQDQAKKPPDLEKQAGDYSKLYLGALGAILGGLIIALRLLEEKAEIADSPKFIEALKLWTPVITASNNTPRHYKRAVNQLRLLAMRSEIEDKKSDFNQPADQLTIRFIVLKALRDLQIDFLKFLEAVKMISVNNIADQPDHDDKQLNNLVSNFKTHLELKAPTPAGKIEDFLKVLAKTVIEHKKQFKDIWPTEEDVILYRELMQGITLR